MIINQMTNEEMEDFADQVKSVILSALVKEKKLENDEAEEWAESHTLIIRKKNIFRTLSNKWMNVEVDSKTLTLSVVNKVI